MRCRANYSGQALAKASDRSGVATTGNVPPSAHSDWHAWKIRYAGEVEEKKYGNNLRVPFWIVRVPPQIIDDHGGIWSDNSMALMAAIFRFRYPKKGPGKPYTLPSRPDVKHEQLYRSVQ